LASISTTTWKTVLVDEHHMSLRSAVLEHIERTKKGLATSRFASRWILDRGKKPAHFDARHIEALTQLPEFNPRRPLPQRE
jgi:hypothetical protein